MRPLGPGDKVRLRYETKSPEKDMVYTIYARYSGGRVSLGLYEYPDVEADYMVPVDELILVGDTQ